MAVMSPHVVTPPSETDINARKRVCKACDRCRLKKSKVSKPVRIEAFSCHANDFPVRWEYAM